MDNIIKIDLIDDTSKIDVELTDYNDKEVRDDIEELRQIKVDKIEGKGLSTNDYTTPEKTKLASLENYDDSEVRALIDTKQPRGNYLTNETDPTVPIYVKNISQNNITSWNNKQNALVSGTNIKTINEQSILGSGNITIETGESDYSELSNKPSINDVTLIGNKSLNDLGIQPKGNYLTSEIDPVFSASASAGITSSDITNWNNKGTYSKPSGGIPKTDLASAVQTSLGKADTSIQSSDLTNYVTNTDYATTSTGGVIKSSSTYATSVTNGGVLYGNTITYSNYSNTNAGAFISKGTLENVFTGKGLLPIVTLTQTQYDNLSTKDANTYYYIIEE